MESDIRINKPRLLIVGGFPPSNKKVFGGIVSSCRALLNSSLPSRTELILIDSTQASNPPQGSGVRLLRAIFRILEFVIKTERYRPAVTILFSSGGASLIEKGAMAWYSKIRGIRAIIFPRSGSIIEECERSRVKLAMTKLMFRGAHMIFCQGEKWFQFVSQELGFSAAHSKKIENWTATNELLEIGRTSRGKNEEVRLLFVGWLDESKGVWELLLACQELAARGTNFVLDLVGEGNLSDKSRLYVERENLAHVVNFHGWKDGEDLLKHYSTSDIFVLPSWSEGMPNAMIEAMAAGLPVVVTSVGNIPDTIFDGETGFIVPIRQPAVLAMKLQYLIENEDIRAKVGRAAHEVAQSMFGVERAVENILMAVTEATVHQKRVCS